MPAPARDTLKPHCAGGEEQREDGRDVVGLAAEQHHHAERSEAGDTHRSVGAAEQEHQPGDCEQQYEVEVVPLAEEKSERGDPVELAGLQVLHLGCNGIAELHLAHDAGAADGEREEQRGPGPGRQQVVPERRQQHGGGDADADEGYAELGEEADAECGTEQQPGAWGAGTGGPLELAEVEEREEGAGPPELIEHHGLEEIAGAEEQGTQAHGKTGGDLGDGAAAQPASGDHGEQHQRGGRDGGEEPDGEQGAAQQLEGGERRHCDEGRKIHGPELEVLGHGEIEEFVAVEAVGGDEVDGEVEQEDEGAEGEGGGDSIMSHRGSQGSRG